MKRCVVSPIFLTRDTEHSVVGITIPWYCPAKRPNEIMLVRNAKFRSIGRRGRGVEAP